MHAGIFYCRIILFFWSNEDINVLKTMPFYETPSSPHSSYGNSLPAKTDCRFVLTLLFHFERI